MTFRLFLALQTSRAYCRTILHLEAVGIKPFVVALLASAIFFGGSPAPTHAAQVTVFAAASLTEALTKIAAAHEKQSGDKITFNFGASSTLVRQIEEGAPADIFFSADEAKMDQLEKQGLILKSTRTSRLSNT